MKRRSQPTVAHTQQSQRPSEAAQFPSNAIWLNTAQAAAYTGRPTRAAFREWARRHGIVSSCGSVSRLDIDAAFERIRQRRQAAIAQSSKQRLRRAG